MNWHKKASQLGLDRGLLAKLGQLNAIQHEVGTVPLKEISTKETSPLFINILDRSTEQTR